MSTSVTILLKINNYVVSSNFLCYPDQQSKSKTTNLMLWFDIKVDSHAFNYPISELSWALSEPRPQ